MLYNTKGIVFHQTKYTDTSSIIRIYTQTFGLQTYIVKGIRSKHSKTKSSLFLNLSLLDLVVYNQPNKSIQFIKEVKSDYQYQTLYTDVNKSAVVLFLNELLNKVVKEIEANNELFNFIHDSMIALDKAEKNFSNFHLYFIVELTSLLGCFPQQNYSEEYCFFNMKEGKFDRFFANTLYDKNNDYNPCMNKELSYLFYNIICGNKELQINNFQRRELIAKIIDYYKLHITEFGAMKSINVLQSLFE